MSDQNGRFPVPFVQTKGYRLFTELCDVCRSAHSIGLGYGPQAPEKPSLLDITRSGAI